jgi:hypothetical protein
MHSGHDVGQWEGPDALILIAAVHGPTVRPYIGAGSAVTLCGLSVDTFCRVPFDPTKANDFTLNPISAFGDCFA